MKRIMAMIFVIVLQGILAGCHTSVNVGWNSRYVYEDASLYTMGGGSITDDVSVLEVSWICGTVTVQYHDGEEILISEKAKRTLSENDSLYYRVVGDTLKVQYVKSDVWTNIDFEKDLTIFLPRGETAYEFSFDSISADINVSDIDTKTCEMETVSGNAQVSLLGNVSLLEIETVSGNVNAFVKSLASFEIESVSGDVILHGGDMQGGTFDSVSGNLSLMIPEECGYTLEFETVSGELDLSADAAKDGDRYTVGDGARRYEMETVSGNVKIGI